MPREFKYEVIPAVAKQFQTVSGLLNRPDVDTIYICTDSGREGEYIYRLVDQMAGVHGKTRKRVWIDSPDGGGDPEGNPGGEGLVRLRQSVRLRLPASQGGLPHGDQFLPPSDPQVRALHLQLPADQPDGAVRGRVMTCVPGHGGAPGAGDP